MQSLDELERRVADALRIPAEIARLCLCDPLLLSDVLEMTVYAEHQWELAEDASHPWLINASSGRRRTAPLTPFERVAYLALGMMIVPPATGGRLDIVGPDRRGRWGLYKWEPLEDEETPDDVGPLDTGGISYLTRDGWCRIHPEDIEDAHDVVNGDYVAYNPLYAVLEVWRIQQKWQTHAETRRQPIADATEPGSDEEFIEFE